jgi:hypothetical protein
MANELSTAGISFLYQLSSPTEVPPTSGWNVLPGIKSTPDYDSSPNMLQVTDLSDVGYHRYIPGLRALNEPWELSANLTQVNIDTWNNIVNQYRNRQDKTLVCWFTFSVPELSVAPYIYGIPYTIGVPAMEVDSVLEVSFTVVPNKILDVWYPKVSSGGAFTTPASFSSPALGGTYTIGSAITGNATTGATVTVYIDGEQLPTVTAESGNIFSVTPDPELAAGVHYLRVKQTIDSIDSPTTEPMLINAISA